MKNYIIGFLFVCILVLGSQIYKDEKLSQNKNIFSQFPIILDKKTINNNDIVKLNLFIFFSQKNCGDCLQIIEVLNNLPNNFNVIGFVPNHELQNEMDLRKNTGAIFELRPIKKKLLKYLPIYTPTLYGVGKNGNIYFVLPGVPKEKDYLKKFLESFYYKSYTLL